MTANTAAALVLGAFLATSRTLEARARTFSELAEQSLVQIQGTLDVPGLAGTRRVRGRTPVE